MKRFLRSKCVLSLLCAGAASASGQSDVDSTSKFAFGENIGWTNWRDAGSPAGSQGARVHDSFLSGFVWGENVGWINLGDGSPSNGVHYGNTTGADFGVNFDTASGELFGLAWGENIGWINFDAGSAATPPRPVRIESVNGVCRLTGFAWGENVGWLNLDDATRFVAVPGICDSPCDLAADLDQDGDVDLQDMANLLAHFGTASGATFEDGDVDDDGDVELQDLAILLANF